MIYNTGKFKRMMSNKQAAIERLHEDYRLLQKLKEKEKSEEEWVRMQTTGGGAET